MLFAIHFRKLLLIINLSYRNGTLTLIWKKKLILTEQQFVLIFDVFHKYSSNVKYIYHDISCLLIFHFPYRYGQDVRDSFKAASMRNAMLQLFDILSSTNKQILELSRIWEILTIWPISLSRETLEPPHIDLKREIPRWHTFSYFGCWT